MIRLTNLTDEEIKAIGRRIGRAFYDEGEGLFTRLDREDAVKALEIMAECYYRLGVLYTTSEQQEGYLAYWRKGEGKEWGMKMVRVSFHMAWRFLREIPFGVLKKLLPLMSNPYEKIYQKEPDYVVISMVAVRREFQGQGYLRVLLGEPFLHRPGAEYPLCPGHRHRAESEKVRFLWHEESGGNADKGWRNDVHDGEKF